VLGEIGTLLFLSGTDNQCQKCGKCQSFQHNSVIVLQKPLTSSNYWSTLNT
jgi:hypothetical protein